jgi:hypothetical protein
MRAHEFAYPVVAILAAASRATRAPRFRLTRDLTMFLLGGSAFAYETITGGDRPNVLYGALALMGVAAYLRGVVIAEKDAK